jgi:ribonuclease P protein subunit RPR2
VQDAVAVAQALKYAEELQQLYTSEREQRRAAEEALGQVSESYRMTVRALAAALELRDDATGAHAERVTALGLRLAERVSPDLAANPQLEYGFLLHDLGKIGIPDGILRKPGPLDDAEREQMQFHPLLGERIVAGVPYLDAVVGDVVRSHHERWDGSGYPHGLHEEQIPLGARIFAVVDSYDAMTNDRPWRPALPVTEALAEIERCAGGQFEPRIAEAFLSLPR